MLVPVGGKPLHGCRVDCLGCLRVEGDSLELHLLLDDSPTLLHT